MKSKDKWLKFRHKIMRSLFYLPIKLFLKVKYGVSIQYYPGDQKRNYLILSNHHTSMDQFFPYFLFHGLIYPLATENIPRRRHLAPVRLRSRHRSGAQLR